MTNLLDKTSTKSKKNHSFLYLFIFFFLLFYSNLDVLADQIKNPNNYSLLDEFIQEKINDDKLVGLNIAIVVGKNIVWQKGYGYSNRQLGVRTTGETLYQVGALSGVFTSALVLRLVNLGLIKLDDDIRQYLPDFKIRYQHGRAPIITVRNLLTHHAGLPLNIFKDSWGTEPISIHSLSSPQVEINASYPPDFIFSFSNIGYSLLGLIIEKVTKLPFPSAMEKYLFSVQNMNNSTVNFRDAKMKKLAVGYKDGDPKVKIFPRDTPSVGLASSIEDLAKFIPLYFHDQQNYWKGLNESIRVQNSDILLDIEKKVGYSWYVDGMDVKGGGPVVWRGGTTPYFRSRISMLPKHKIGVIVLSNDSRSWNAISEISEKALNLILEFDFNIKQPKTSDEILSTKNIEEGEFADAYSSFIGLISIVNKKNSIKANIIGWPISLIKDKKNSQWYDLQYDLLGFIPIDISWISDIKIRPAKIGKHSVLIAHYKGRKILFGQMLEQSKIHQEWKSLTGKYKIRNKDILMDIMKTEEGELIIRNNRLLFTYELPVWFGLELEIPVLTTSTSRAIIPGLGTGLNETVSIKTINGERVLEYSGYILEKQKVKETLNFDF